MKFTKLNVLSITFVTLLILVSISFALRSSKSTMTILFIVGAIIHLAIILGKDFFSKKLVLTLFISLAGLLPGKKEREYDLYVHILMSLLVFILLASIQFRKKILQVIDEKRVIQIFIISLFIGLQIFFKDISADGYAIRSIVLISAIIISPYILLIILSKRDIPNFLKLILYVWFIFFSLIIVLMQIDFRILTNLISSEEFFLFTKQDYLNAIMSGIVLVPIIANSFYLIDLLPIPGKRQSFKSRIKEVKVTIKEYIAKYDSKQTNMKEVILIFLLQGGLLVINLQFGIVSEEIIILASILFSEIILDFRSKQLS